MLSREIDLEEKYIMVLNVFSKTSALMPCYINWVLDILHPSNSLEELLLLYVVNAQL